MANARYSYEEKTIKVFGRPVSFIEAGQGEPLLLLHSWPTCNRIFKELINFFPRNYRLIAPDLPGFGLSSQMVDFHGLNDFVDFLGEFLRVLKIRKANLLGVSVGGVICLKYAILRPKKVKKVIAISTPIWVKGFIPDWQLKFSLSLNNPGLINLILGLARTDLYYWFYTRVEFLDILEKNSLEAEALVKSIFAQAREADNKTVAKTIFSLIRTDLRAGLARLRKPTLFIIGGKDNTRMVGQLEEFCPQFENLTLAKIPQGTHRLIINDANEVSKIVVAFLKSRPKA
jgi:pimeloyl-ACP methyl ester carboxylesterase